MPAAFQARRPATTSMARPSPVPRSGSERSSAPGSTGIYTMLVPPLDAVVYHMDNLKYERLVAVATRYIASSQPSLMRRPTATPTRNPIRTTAHHALSQEGRQPRAPPRHCAERDAAVGAQLTRCAWPPTTCTRIRGPVLRQRQRGRTGKFEGDTMRIKLGSEATCSC